MSTVTCQTDGCVNCDHVIEVPDDGTQVVCGGGCGNTLRPPDPGHPDYPSSPSGPSIEDLIAAEVARQLGAQT